MLLAAQRCSQGSVVEPVIILCRQLTHAATSRVPRSDLHTCLQVPQGVRRTSQLQVLQLLHGADQAAEANGACGVKTASQQPVHVAQQPGEADWEVGGVWGLGTAVTLEEWEHQLGISFRAQHIGEKALYGGLEPDAFM